MYQYSLAFLHLGDPLEHRHIRQNQTDRFRRVETVWDKRQMLFRQTDIFRISANDRKICCFLPSFESSNSVAQFVHYANHIVAR